MKKTTAPAIAGTLVMGIACSPAQADPAPATAATESTNSTTGTLQEITVTAQRLELLGFASTASEGVVDDQELQLAPQYRPGQLLETVPGLIVTLHSGEGKANQYLMRGYNLDHGTDLETYVDGMPINQPTHAHGQGYTDLNFMIPELTDQLGYTKGPYYANVGDFGAVGSVRVDYRDTIDDQVSATAGTLDFQRLFAAGTQALGDGHLLAAVELQHYDGPFVAADDARKDNVLLRYSDGDEKNGYSISAMMYHQLWTNTTDIPIRAITEDLVPDRFGTLDPSDGGRAWRSSLSFNLRETLGEGRLTGSGFFIDNQLHLWNDFTHYLVDPVHGDQEDQFEHRDAFGGQAGYTLPLPLGSIDNTVSAGVLVRNGCILDGASVNDGALLGPYAHLRPGSDIGEGAHVGNFVETKKIKLGKGVKAGHLTYLGDAEIGEGTNIGAGVITCNYDGVNKHRTTIGSRVHGGVHTSFVAPVDVGDDAWTAAGTVVTADVPAGALAVARARQRNVEAYGERRAQR